MEQNVSLQEKLNNPTYKAMYEARQKSFEAKQFIKTNEIGEETFVEWNPFTLKKKGHHQAMVIAQEFDLMLKETIPTNKILSTRFQNWITKEKNNLMLDKRLNKDKYFSKQVDENGEQKYQTGESIVDAQFALLQKELEKLQKSFATHMQNNPQIAFANQEQQLKWKEYYEKQSQIVNSNLANNHLESYDRKNGMTPEENAMAHAQNLDNKLNIVNQMLEEQKAYKEHQAQQNTAGQSQRIESDFTNQEQETLLNTTIRKQTH